MASKHLGVEFGTDTIKMYRKGAGLIYFEKTALSVKNKKNIIAIGAEAYEMYGKSPDNIEVVFPIKNGVIASFNQMLSLLNCIFLDLSKAYGKFRGATFTIAIPADITDVEKKSFYDMVDNCFIRPKNITLIDKPIADAIGCGVDLNKSDASMVVNVGCETTEISVISTGGIILSRIVPLGGKTFDEALTNAMRKNFNIQIGQKTAEFLKKKIASFDENENKEYTVFGRDVVSGLPKQCLITSKLIRSNMVDTVNTIIDAVRAILDRTPPEISSDIFRDGIYLTGGTANVPGIADIFSTGLGLKVEIPKHPAETVVDGLAEIVEERIRVE